MINALFSSQAGGTKMFTAADGTTFGWKAILDLYSREYQRRDKGHARTVPKLCESYVFWDAWTKLNVLPAKIMQVLENFFVYGSTNYQLSARTCVGRIASVHYPGP